MSVKQKRATVCHHQTDVGAWHYYYYYNRAANLCEGQDSKRRNSTAPPPPPPPSICCIYSITYKARTVVAMRSCCIVSMGHCHMVANSHYWILPWFNAVWILWVNAVWFPRVIYCVVAMGRCCVLLLSANELGYARWPIKRCLGLACSLPTFLCDSRRNQQPASHNRHTETNPNMLMKAWLTGWKQMSNRSRSCLLRKCSAHSSTSLGVQPSLESSFLRLVSVNKPGWLHWASPHARYGKACSVKYNTYRRMPGFCLSGWPILARAVWGTNTEATMNALSQNLLWI